MNTRDHLLEALSKATRTSSNPNDWYVHPTYKELTSDPAGLLQWAFFRLFTWSQDLEYNPWILMRIIRERIEAQEDTPHPSNIEKYRTHQGNLALMIDDYKRWRLDHKDWI